MKSDVTIAKNYLDEKQIRRLERAVSGYFDYIEDLIEDFVSSANEFLAFRRFDILHGKGKVSKKEAAAKATIENNAFNLTQKITSDFDGKVRKMLDEGGAKHE